MSQKKTILEMQEFAASKNGYCLSEKYEGNKHKLLWQCESGHRWLAKYNMLNSCDSWCPECANAKRGRRIDITGKRFNKLVAVEVSYRNKQGIYWKCICDCGQIKSIRTGQLNSGQHQSCGCLRKENIQKIAGHNKKPKGEAGFSILLNHYKYKAKERKLVFELSELEFRSLVVQNCYYCNIEPFQKSKAISGDFFVYNGIDRLDSSKGYVYSNCVTACGICNFMKREQNIENFLKQVKTIYETRIK